MTNAAIIDALFCIPKKGVVSRISDCVPFTEDLAPRMQASGISGAVLANGNCAECQHQWNCADRRTQEVVETVAQNPSQLRGLAAYDPLRIGESLRWIDDAVGEGRLAGAYVQAECCVGGLDAAFMYPLYGVCAKLRAPFVVDFADEARWKHHLPQVELIAADFPEVDIVLAPPMGAGSAGVVRMLQRFPHVSVLLRPEDLRSNAALREYVEFRGREQTMFRSSAAGWPAAVEAVADLSLSPAAERAYLFENATRVFSFPFLALRETA